jgi:hypothetical protein
MQREEVGEVKRGRKKKYITDNKKRRERSKGLNKKGVEETV